VQARLRVLVKRLLKKYEYPPDKQQKATDTVLEQAKLLCADWAENQLIQWQTEEITIQFPKKIFEYSMGLIKQAFYNVIESENGL